MILSRLGDKTTELRRLRLLLDALTTDQRSLADRLDESNRSINALTDKVNVLTGQVNYAFGVLRLLSDAIDDGSPEPMRRLKADLHEVLFGDFVSDHDRMDRMKAVFESHSA